MSFSIAVIVSMLASCTSNLVFIQGSAWIQNHNCYIDSLEFCLKWRYQANRPPKEGWLITWRPKSCLKNSTGSLKMYSSNCIMRQNRNSDLAPIVQLARMSADGNVPCMIQKLWIWTLGKSNFKMQCYEVVLWLTLIVLVTTIDALRHI